MPLSLAERLSATRYDRFVGRRQECELFRSALNTIPLPFSVLHVFGPGGVGKTSLLWEFVRICQESGYPCLYLDARNIEPSPQSFFSSLRLALGQAATDSPLRILANQSDRFVLLIDTHELLAPIDEWLRQVFLPQLSEHVLVVFASRHPPALAWRTDPNWQVLLHSLSLRNLNPDESCAYLSKRRIPTDEHSSVLDFTHGHPLALSLVADLFAQGQNIDLAAKTDPNVIKTLLDKFLEEIPSPAHRMALESCAIVRLTTEALLGVMLNLSDVHGLFVWLRGLSFIELGQTGFFPHDLARQVLVTDLRWRNPDWYAELHQRSRTYYTTRLGQTQGQEQHRILFDYIFLHRDNPAVKPRFMWQENSSLQTGTVRESDFVPLIEMVRQHEGEASAQLATHWLIHQPQGVLAIRDTQQELVGFVLMVSLHQANFSELEADPAAIACWRYLQNHAPLRQGEGATLFRFWMDRDHYQDVSPAQSLIFINLVQYYRSTPGLAYTFLPCADPEFWTSMFSYADLERLPEADFTIGDRTYGMYGHDWRVVSPSAWQDLLARREIAASALAITPDTTSETLLVLSQAEFIKAVQEALQNFTRPDGLQQNPLLRSRFVVEQLDTNPSPCDRVQVLQQLIQQVAESFQSSPRDEKLYRALYRTYLRPAPTQEQAAELLDLPFSTYRRHLKTGVTRLADILWQREIG
jgi:hypothetical protein